MQHLLLDLQYHLHFLKQLGKFDKLGKVKLCEIKASDVFDEGHSFLDTVGVHN